MPRRPLIAGRRAPHRAFCSAWWMRNAPGECVGSYEVRLAGAGRRLVVIQTYRPWCLSFPAVRL